MAIFGKNGAWAAALYLGTLFALYGQKNAGFKDDKEVQEIVSIVARKGIAADIKRIGGKKGAARKQAVASLREKRFAALTGERYKSLAEDVEFKKQYMKKEWAR